MGYTNTLCVDNRCKGPAGCAHLGPQGQHCWFYPEQKLCEVLHLHWHPGLEFDSLITMIQDKLAMLPGPDDYAGQVRLATAKTQPAVPVLSATPEEET